MSDKEKRLKTKKKDGRGRPPNPSVYYSGCHPFMVRLLVVAGSRRRASQILGCPARALTLSAMSDPRHHLTISALLHACLVLEMDPVVALRWLILGGPQPPDGDGDGSGDGDGTEAPGLPSF